jgi:hypothetical protein
MGTHMCSYSPLRCHLLHARNLPGLCLQSAGVSEQAVWQSCPHMGDECPRPNTWFIGRPEDKLMETGTYTRDLPAQTLDNSDLNIRSSVAGDCNNDG